MTAAHELLEQSDIKPVVFEASPYIGGISKTIHYMGNHIDIGGHRFFSKSKRVMDWWQSVLPLQGKASRDYLALGRDIPLSEEPGAPDPEKSEKVMLLRQRLSRILFDKKLLSYPISLSIDTLSKLGIPRTIRIALSYLRTRIVPIREEKSLEDFFINRFGRELYQTFFLDYTEKVWGVPCSAIKPEWGSQRVKGLSITKVLLTAVKRIFSRDKSIEQQDVETSLIERFLYPKYGPGQMWEEVAERIMARGCSVHLNKKVTGIEHEGGRVVAVNVTDMETGELERREGDFFLSTMPVRDLIAAMGEAVPSQVAEVARGLMYRDFITVGILLRKMKIRNESKIPTVDGIIPDNWVWDWSQSHLPRRFRNIAGHIAGERDFSSTPVVKEEPMLLKYNHSEQSVQAAYHMNFFPFKARGMLASGGLFYPLLFLWVLLLAGFTLAALRLAHFCADKRTGSR